MKPRALDLFCGAGGSTRGLQRAGFHVTGVDIAEQPNYCGDDFVRGDWATSDAALSSFSFVWASPPCQSFTAYRRKDPATVGAAYPNLIPQVRDFLRIVDLPCVIENVGSSPLIAPLTLCGSMFGLEVRRHRLFECSFPVGLVPPCAHGSQRGEFPQATNRANRRKTVEVGVWRIPLEVQQRAMGIDWMTLEELSEAIPPAYSEFLGRAALKHIRKEAA